MITASITASSHFVLSSVSSAKTTVHIVNVDDVESQLNLVHKYMDPDRNEQTNDEKITVNGFCCSRRKQCDTASLHIYDICRRL